MSASLLSVEDLRTQIKGHGDRRPTTVVDGVSFDLETQQVLALIGESGSGKTMTALSILRLVVPLVAISGGRVRYLGKDLLRLPDDEMRMLRGRQIAMVFQNPRDRFDPLRTIGDQLIEVLRHHGVAQNRDEASRRALELLHEVQLVNVERVMKMYPNEASGGKIGRASCRERVLTGV